ncbi:glycogen debranching N-terminal domain-containing protein [Streptomyces sp. NPDC054796]
MSPAPRPTPPRPVVPQPGAPPALPAVRNPRAPHPAPAPIGPGRNTSDGSGKAPSPGARAGARPVAPPPRPEYQPAHTSLIGVSAPSLVISADHGQLTGSGMEGFFHVGRRVIARCQLRVDGREPSPVQGRMIDAGQARFVAAARTATSPGPDPEILVERLRSAEGTERITLRSAAAGTVRFPVEVRLGTDLAELGAVAAGARSPELPADVHGPGLSWSSGSLRATVTSDPAPDTALASAGLLRWEWELAPGASRSVLLTVRLEPSRSGREPLRAAQGPAGLARRSERPPRPWGAAGAEGDDGRVRELFRTSLDDLGGLLLRDAACPPDLHLAAGAPWRCSLAPAEALRAARMLLPLGTRLAAGTLRTLARTQLTAPGPEHGRIPGPLRNAGPHAPPRCTGTEATLLFPAVLAEAWRWGLPARELELLFPAARRCLGWLRAHTKAGGYLPDPAPEGPFRCETQAHAYRAALLGADLLEAQDADEEEELREWAAALRERFRQDFWHENRGGGRPLSLLATDGATTPYLGSTAAELLDTGLTAGGLQAEGLLDKPQTQQLARLLGGPSLDSGWGLRSLGAKEPRHNPFGHRSGAVRVEETVTAVVGLANAGHENEAGALLRGMVDAAETFGFRLPEMYAAEQRTEGSVPLPHPSACRPAAVAAAGAVRLLTTLAGVRPDVPAGTVTVRPLSTAPLGAVRFTGLRVAGEPFAVRVSRLGLGLVEEVSEGLHLRG